METIESKSKAILRCKDPKRARTMYLALNKQERQTFARNYYKGLQVKYEVRRHQYLVFEPRIRTVEGNYYISVYPKIGSFVVGFEITQEFHKLPTAEQVLKAIQAELPSVKIL